jgi:hypothetical protein
MMMMVFTYAPGMAMIAPLIHYCRPIADRLAANHVGYFHRHRHLIAAVCIAAFADMLTTIRFMHIDGIDHEMHPAIRLVATIAGPLLGPILGKLAQLAAIWLVTLYARRLAPYIFVAATMMYAWAAWYNVWGREMYMPLLLKWWPG